MTIIESISKKINRSICDSQETYDLFWQMIESGLITQAENTSAHFCVRFIPYNYANKTVFIVDHKKSGLWLPPGGHLEKQETLFSALNREINEELGVKDFFKSEPEPFLLTATFINDPARLCKTHFDIWYLMPTDGKDFQIDLSEFHDTRWLNFEEARKLITDGPSLIGLTTIENTLIH